jgi:hypothetical protein
MFVSLYVECMIGRLKREDVQVRLFPMIVVHMHRAFDRAWRYRNDILLYVDSFLSFSCTKTMEWSLLRKRAKTRLTGNLLIQIYFSSLRRALLLFCHLTIDLSWYLHLCSYDQLVAHSQFSHQIIRCLVVSQYGIGLLFCICSEHKKEKKIKTKKMYSIHQNMQDLKITTHSKKSGNWYTINMLDHYAFLIIHSNRQSFHN